MEPERSSRHPKTSIEWQAECNGLALPMDGWLVRVTEEGNWLW